MNGAELAEALRDLMREVGDSPMLKPHERKIILRVIEREDKRAADELSTALSADDGGTEFDIGALQQLRKRSP